MRATEMVRENHRPICLTGINVGTGMLSDMVNLILERDPDHRKHYVLVSSIQWAALETELFRMAMSSKTFVHDKAQLMGREIVVMEPEDLRRTIHPSTLRPPQRVPCTE